MSDKAERALALLDAISEPLCDPIKRTEVASYPVTIFVAGEHGLHEIDRECQRYCDEIGLCVTLTRADYIYTGGRESGFAIGLINYPRFPSEAEDIFARAEELARRIIENEFCRVQSATVQAPDRTVWLRTPRDSDATRQGGDANAAPVPKHSQARAGMASPNPATPFKGTNE